MNANQELAALLQRADQLQAKCEELDKRVTLGITSCTMMIDRVTEKLAELNELHFQHAAFAASANNFAAAVAERAATLRNQE